MDNNIAAIIRPDRCEVCKFASPSPNNPQLLDCHRFPPTIAVFPTKSENDQILFQEYTALPKVHPANHCGEHRPRIELIN